MAKRLKDSNPKIILLSLSLLEVITVFSSGQQNENKEPNHLVLKQLSKESFLVIIEDLARGSCKDDEQVQEKAGEMIGTFAIGFDRLKDIYPEFQAVKLRYDMYKASVNKSNENVNVSGHLLNSTTPSQKRRMEQDLANITKGGRIADGDDDNNGDSNEEEEGYVNQIINNSNNDINEYQHQGKDDEGGDDEDEEDDDDIDTQYIKLESDTYELKMMIAKAEDEIKKNERFGSKITDEFLDVLDFMEQSSLRLIDLVEAATLGYLRDETMLELYLDLNDKVLLIIEEMKNLVNLKGHDTTPDLIMFSSSLASNTPASLLSSNDGYMNQSMNVNVNANTNTNTDELKPLWDDLQINLSTPPPSSNIPLLESLLSGDDNSNDSNKKNNIIMSDKKDDTVDISVVKEDNADVEKKDETSEDNKDVVDTSSSAKDDKDVDQISPSSDEQQQDQQQNENEKEEGNEIILEMHQSDQINKQETIENENENRENKEVEQADQVSDTNNKKTVTKKNKNNKRAT